MKPHVTCHMVASIDGRTLTSRWRPEDPGRRQIFEKLHERLAVDAWLVGRITGHEYAKRNSYPDHVNQGYAREPWFARRDALAYGIVLDPHGKIAWGRDNIGDDPIVVVLTESVSDGQLAGLREDDVSYIFAGEHALDLRRALDILNGELGIKRLEVRQLRCTG
jgi:riboflavin biosynthesis pyrimidine reductase